MVQGGWGDVEVVKGVLMLDDAIVARTGQPSMMAPESATRAPESPLSLAAAPALTALSIPLTLGTP
jgi:hypothetical protein